MVIFEENFKWHLEAFASELFIHHNTGFSLQCSRAGIFNLFQAKDPLVDRETRTLLYQLNCCILGLTYNNTHVVLFMLIYLLYRL